MSELSKTSSRNHAIDMIKGLGLVLIAALHVGMYMGQSIGLNYVINTVMRFAVPFFFLAAGYMVYRKLGKDGANPARVLFGNAGRIALLYVLAMAICLLVPSLYYGPEFLEQALAEVNLKSDFLVWDALYYGWDFQTTYHLWFLVAMFWSSLVIALVCFWRPANIGWLVIVALAIHLAGLFGVSQPYSKLVELPLFPRDGVFMGLFYMALGAWWARGGTFLAAPVWKKWALPGILLFTLLQLGERSLLVWLVDPPFEAGEWAMYGGEYFIFTVPLVVCLFRWALDHPAVGRWNPLTWLGRNSLGVYVVHALVITAVWELIGMNNAWTLTKTIGFQTAFPFAVILVSFLITWPFHALGGLIKKRLRR